MTTTRSLFRALRGAIAGRAIGSLYAMRKISNLILILAAAVAPFAPAAQSEKPAVPNPAGVLWYSHPAAAWDAALPVGNGRLGGLVWGKTDEEQILLNEDTLWSGGPYSTVVMGGAAYLPELRKAVFDGQFKKAYVLFSRHFLGYPVEQMKYQALGTLVLKFPSKDAATGYRHQLDLDTAVATTRYEQNGIRFTREVFSSPVDQVLVVRLTAGEPGKLSFVCQLQGSRNQAHSNYATDYFRMDGSGPDGLVLRGKSADYMGVEGKLRYEARLRAAAEGGTVKVVDDELVVSGADAVTLILAAATNFVSYKDVSADPAARVETAMKAVRGKAYDALRADHVKEHQRLFRRVAMILPATANSALPTDERLKAFDGANDPALAALVFQFGRYLLISSSRPGTQPANLQGIWNKDQNPMWDSKYTTNINTEMNYWPAEVGNLSECAEPLFAMVKDLTDQGSQIARENYGARGWVYHQNTDLWRVAAPMDGASWGTFTTGGAWLSTHLWEHFLYTGDETFLREYYPVLKGSAQFFLDFLIPHPTKGWLVTNPSTSPENFPAGPAAVKFFDEITMFNTGASICAGSTIDMAILRDLFAAVAKAADVLGVDPDFKAQVLAARSRLAPMQIGRKGNLQEWLDDWDETEKSHRHISGLWGLFPGAQISPRRTPELAAASAVVLDQRGLPGNGWASAWKAACWARLGNPAKAMDNFTYAMRTYTTPALFSICSRAMQVDGAFGMTAVVAEMLLQSHEDELNLLPALPVSWTAGEVSGLVARGGFEVGLRWAAGRLERATLVSRLGNVCRIRAAAPFEITSNGKAVATARRPAGAVEFKTTAGQTYVLTAVPGTAGVWPAKY
jgi:alpha-L-fucosidase 2